MNYSTYTIIFSGVAVTLSLTSLVITLIQKNNETKRSIRKTLSDTLEGISKINIETAKLSSNKEMDEQSKITLRRHFNSQRRILTAHGDFLVNKYKKMATDIDCNLLAGAYSSIGFFERAEYYWQQTIEKSISNSIKHMNLRGFGNFLFHQGKIELGRSKFIEALNLQLSNNDENNMLIADTHLMLATLEKDLGNITEFENQITQTMVVQGRVIQKGKQNEIQERIRYLVSAKANE